jgi:hypothetical protein
MPYSSVSEAEKKNPGLEKYSAKAKRGWLSSFNSCMKDSSDESKCFAIAYSVANKAVAKKAADMENEAEHNDKYDAECGCCGAAREVQDIALDLQDIEPKIAMALMNEARSLRASDA